MSFTNVFGNGPLYPADVAYLALSLSANLTLTWPAFTVSSATLAARTMDVTATAAGLNLTLPPANQVSTGYDLLISNRGTNTFNVLNNAGGAVATLLAGQSKYIQVTDNTTTAGLWNLVAFGAVSSPADPSGLAGYGLAANGVTLQASQPSSTFSASSTISPTDRSKVYIWTGGVGTQTLPATISVGTDFFYAVRNQGSGALTITAAGGEFIDGSASVTLQPTESAELHAGVGNWYSVGRGRSTQFNFTLLVKNVTGGTVTLTSTEAANVVQEYTGTLTSNSIIVVPSVVQVYYVSNQTAGAFTVTFKTSGTGASISVPANQNAVLFCDGLNVINTSTTVSGLTGLLLAQGSVGSPSIGYSGDSSTGIYQPAGGQVAVTTTGVQAALFSSTGLTLAGGLSATTGAFSAQVTANAAPTLPAHLTNKAYTDGKLALTGGTLTGSLGGTTATLSGALSGATATFSGAVTAAGFSGPLTGHASLDLPLTGGTVSTGAAQVLVVDSTSAAGGFLALSQAGTIYGYYGNAGTLSVGGTLNDLGIRFNNALSISGSGGAERMRIDASGNVGIGGPAGAKLNCIVTAGESLRLTGSATYMAFYNTANTTRSGYLQIHDSAASVLMVEINQDLRLGTNGLTRLQITAGGAVLDGAGNELGYKGLPTNAQTVAYAVVQADKGKKIQQAGAAAITVNTGLSDDFVCSVANYSGGALSLVAGAGVTFHLAGTATTGNRTLAVWGVANFVKIAGVEIYIVSGNVT